MRITFITVCKNNSDGLRRTIESLRPLKYREDCEFIFIDGGSTDESVNYASGFYKDSLSISEYDRGVYHAMNKGFSLSSGDYIIWINSGDIFFSHTIDNVLKALECGCDMCAFSTEVYSSEGSDYVTKYDPTKNRFPRYTLPHPSTFFLRSALTNYGLYDESFKICADYELMLRIYKAGGSFSVSPLLTTRFFLGGLSSITDYRSEHTEILYKYGEISLLQYLLKKSKQKIRKIYLGEF